MKRVGRRAAAAHIVVAAFAFAGCKRDSGAPGALRVVSISPNMTEAMFAIGAGASLVGRSKYCDYPPEASKLPAVGGWMDPSFETILGLAPTWVIGARGPGLLALVKRFEARGIATYFPETESIAQVDAMVEGLGQRVGHTAEGAALATKMRADRDAIAKAVAPLPKRKTLLVFGLTPIFVAGPGSFADEMLSLAGGDNPMRRAAGGHAAPNAQIDIEQVLAMDPDVILDAAFGEHQADGSMGPAWANVRAAREGRIVRLEDPVVLRPGPRVAEGIRTIAKALHPDLSLPP